jgi:hypothetical protein
MNKCLLYLIALTLVQRVEAQKSNLKMEVALIDSYAKATSDDSLFHKSCHDLFAVENSHDKIGSACTEYFSVRNSKGWRKIVTRRLYPRNEYISTFFYKNGNLVKAQLSQIKNDSVLYFYSYYIKKNSVIHQIGQDYPLVENGIDIFSESKRLQKQFIKQ